MSIQNSDYRSLDYIITTYDPVIENAIRDIESFYDELYKKSREGRLTTEENITSPIVFRIDGERVDDKRVRAREYNKHKEEKLIGADIGISIEYLDDNGQISFKKGILIQSKIVHYRPFPRVEDIHRAQKQCMTMLQRCSASFLKLYDPNSNKTYYIPAMNFAFTSLRDSMHLSDFLSAVYYQRNTAFYRLMLRCFLGEYNKDVDDVPTLMQLQISIPQEIWSKSR